MGVIKISIFVSMMLCNFLEVQAEKSNSISISIIFKVSIHQNTEIAVCTTFCYT